MSDPETRSGSKFSHLLASSVTFLGNRCEAPGRLGGARPFQVGFPSNMLTSLDIFWPIQESSGTIASHFGNPSAPL